MSPRSSEFTIQVKDYDLGMTLTSGQAFRWQQTGQAWSGVIGWRWVGLRQDGGTFHAWTAEPVATWDWLTHYLQLETRLDEIVETFPVDHVLEQAVKACWGLRLLRQSPWECLASFILSSTKQVCQIQQIIALLCDRFGELIPTPPGHARASTFPSPGRIAQCREEDLRACKMGFRAPYLQQAARQIAEDGVRLNELDSLPYEDARAELMQLAGVGEKIADCVLLFAYGYPGAFPIDVWIMRVLRQHYYSGRRPKPARIRDFIRTHFGPNAGYAQQYLYHYSRIKKAGISEMPA
jgi:N-glycosylase/DNA lyase